MYVCIRATPLLTAYHMSGPVLSTLIPFNSSNKPVTWVLLLSPC